MEFYVFIILLVVLCLMGTALVLIAETGFCKVAFGIAGYLLILLSICLGLSQIIEMIVGR